MPAVQRPVVRRATGTAPIRVPGARSSGGTRPSGAPVVARGAGRHPRSAGSPCARCTAGRPPPRWPQPVPLARVAPRAGRHHVVPCVGAPTRAGHDVIQVLGGGPAVLAGPLVARGERGAGGGGGRTRGGA